VGNSIKKTGHISETVRNAVKVSIKKWHIGFKITWKLLTLDILEDY